MTYAQNVSDAQNVSKTTAMPQQNIPPLQAGATSPGKSAIMTQNQNTSQQMALIGKSGGARKRRYRGGNAIIVPAPPPGSVNQSETAAEYTNLTKLAEQQAAQSVYDKGNTANVASAQKGGSWTAWRCLSGGKKSKRRTRKSKRRTRKSNRKTRKSRKH